MPKIIGATPFFLARNLNDTIAFYDKLGFHARHQEDEYAIVARDEVELHFGRDETHRDEDATLCRMQVTGIEALYAEFQPLGIVHPNAELESKPWGTREFSIVDPNNFLIAFYERA